MFKKYINCFLFFVMVSICAGFNSCKSQQSAVIVDTGDIGRLRSEYQQLRNEYDKLQSDYKRLVEDQQFYAEYYLNATAAIGSGLDELANIGTDSVAEIAKLRGYVAILRNIINAIIAGQQEERQQDSGVDGND